MPHHIACGNRRNFIAVDLSLACHPSPFICYIGNKMPIVTIVSITRKSRWKRGNKGGSSHVYPCAPFLHVACALEQNDYSWLRQDHRRTELVHRVGFVPQALSSELIRSQALISYSASRHPIDTGASGSGSQHRFI